MNRPDGRTSEPLASRSRRGCGRERKEETMPKRLGNTRSAQADGIHAVAKLLGSKRRQLDQQLARARKEYPLLALSYLVQKVAIQEIAPVASVLDDAAFPVLHALLVNQADLAQSQVEMSQRLRKLRTCLIRASADPTGQDGFDCFDAFVNG
jgi:hypothetical protein